MFDTGLQVNGGGVVPPPKLLSSSMTMKFLPDVNLHGEMQNLQKNEISHLVCKLWVCKDQNAKIARF